MNPLAVVRATWPLNVESGDGLLSLKLSSWFIGASVAAAKRKCAKDGATFEVVADPQHPKALPPMGEIVCSGHMRGRGRTFNRR